MPPRRRRVHGLERALGTPALFATAYGNVGSSIYYALGVTAAFALGLTPRAGKNLDFEIYGEVVEPGRVAVGDPVEPAA